MYRLAVLAISSIKLVEGFAMGSCPDSWVYSGGSCYMLPMEPQSEGQRLPRPLRLGWIDANKHCRSLGGHLASVLTLNENTVVSTLCRSALPPSSFSDTLPAAATDFEAKCWIGLSGDSETPRWIDGSVSSYTNWGSEQSQNGLRGGPDDSPLPSNCGELGPSAPQCRADCGYIGGGDGTFGYWLCSSHLPFVCRQPFEEFHGSNLFRVSAAAPSQNAEMTIREIQLFGDADCKGDKIDLKTKAKFSLPPGFDEQIDESDSSTRLPSSPSYSVSWDAMVDGDLRTSATVSCDEGDICTPAFYIEFETPVEPQCIKISAQADSPILQFSKRMFNGWQTLPLILENKSREFSSSTSILEQEVSLPRLPGFGQTTMNVNSVFSLAIPIANYDETRSKLPAKNMRMKIVAASPRRRCSSPESPFVTRQHSVSDGASIHTRSRKDYGFIGKAFADSDDKVTTLEWSGFSIVEPGQFRVCVCLGQCDLPDSWQVTSDLFIEGISILHTGEEKLVMSGGLFDYKIVGVGLAGTSGVNSRIKFVSFGDKCDASTTHRNDLVRSPNCDFSNNKFCSGSPVGSRTHQIWRDLSIVLPHPGEGLEALPIRLQVCHCRDNCDAQTSNMFIDNVSRIIFGTKPMNSQWTKAGVIKVAVPLDTCPVGHTCHNSGYCVRSPNTLGSISARNIECVCRVGFSGDICASHQASVAREFAPGVGSRMSAPSLLRLLDAEGMAILWDERQEKFLMDLKNGKFGPLKDNVPLPRLPSIHNKLLGENRQISGNSISENSEPPTSAVSTSDAETSTAPVIMETTSFGDSVPKDVGALFWPTFTASAAAKRLGLNNSYTQGSARDYVATTLTEDCVQKFSSELGRCIVSVHKMGGGFVARYALRQRKDESLDHFASSLVGAKSSLAERVKSNEIWNVVDIANKHKGILPAPTLLPDEESFHQSPSSEELGFYPILWGVIGVIGALAAFALLAWPAVMLVRYILAKQRERDDDLIRNAAIGRTIEQIENDSEILSNNRPM